MKKGGLVLLPFPFTDLTGTKTRPALVLLATPLDVTVAFITTQIGWQEADDIFLTSTAKNGLKKDSLIRLSKIATIQKSLALGLMGELTSSELILLDKNLISILKITV